MAMAVVAAAAPEAVNSTSPMFVASLPCVRILWESLLTSSQQLPFNVGWQDLKDLFRSAGMSPSLMMR
jgi:hypothetical protein